MKGNGQVSKQDKVKVYGIRFCYLFMMTILILYGVGPNELFPFEISSIVLVVSLVFSIVVIQILGRNQPKTKDISQQISNKKFELLLVTYTVGSLLIFSDFGGSEFLITEEPLFYIGSILYLTVISIKIFLLNRKKNNEQV